MEAVNNEPLVHIRKRSSGKKRGLYIRTYGCLMNEYDSEKLAKILEASYDVVSTPEQADLVLVNTCSVREKPELKLYSLLGELRELKDSKPSLMIGVGGCVAQQEGETIVKRNSAVDFVFGTHNLSLVPSLIEKRESLGRPQVAVDYRDEWEELPLGFSGAPRISALVSISRGCNKNCTYCIVPTTRGIEVSRAAAEIEKEIRIAVHRGAKEIVLLGQTVNSWGGDLVPRQKFSSLLERVAAIPGVERIRFISPHPQEVRSDFIELIATNPKICHHIHLPLQSGSDRILKAMNRNYRKARYLSIVEELRSRVPDIEITTDIIVGFPGETEGDFQETLEVMELSQFQNSYAYMFSPRPGTEAALVEDDVPPEEKLKRLTILQKRQEELAAQRLALWLGKEVEVLIDAASSQSSGRTQGRSSQNIVVNIEEAASPGIGRINLDCINLDCINLDCINLVPGSLIKVLITGVSRFSLRGMAL